MRSSESEPSVKSTPAIAHSTNQTIVPGRGRTDFHRSRASEAPAVAIFSSSHRIIGHSTMLASGMNHAPTAQPGDQVRPYGWCRFTARVNWNAQTTSSTNTAIDEGELERPRASNRGPHDRSSVALRRSPSRPARRRSLPPRPARSRRRSPRSRAARPRSTAALAATPRALGSSVARRVARADAIPVARTGRRCRGAAAAVARAAVAPGADQGDDARRWRGRNCGLGLGRGAAVRTEPFVARERRAALRAEARHRASPADERSGGR